MTYRLLSYNVRYAGLDVGENAWKRRRDGVASVVRFHGPDVVCLQEVWQAQLADLRERLPGYEWVCTRSSGGEHTPVGYRPDRFDVVEEASFSLSETPDDLHAYDWDAAIPRVTTAATLRVVGADERFSVVDTHFDHQSPEARARSADLLVERLADRSRPTLVAGDLNCRPDDPPYRTLVGAGFEDAREAVDAPHGPETTFNDFEAPQPGERIDHVLVDGVDVERFGVLADLDARASYPSDHFPLVAEWSFP
jgi:endonuclease/exonuclease/phosphatase family metal-dependent hydrolase